MDSTIPAPVRTNPNGQNTAENSTPVVPASDSYASVDYYPAYGEASDGGALPTVDPSGNLSVRGAILTDEGGYRANFDNSSLAVSIGTATFTNGSATVTGTGFSTKDVHIGDYVYLDADGVANSVQVDYYTDTEITLVSNYAGTGGTGASSRQVVKSVVGTGGTITVSSGQATIAAGTTAASVFEIEREVDYVPLVKQGKFSISQRIANQNIYYGFYDEGAANPRWYFWFNYDGTTNTTVKCECAWNSTNSPSGGEISSTTVTLPNGATSALSNRHRIECLKDRVSFYINDTLVYQEFSIVPHPHDTLTSTLRVVNGTTPATSTSVVVDFDSCFNFNVVSAEYPTQTTSAIAPNVPMQEFSFSQAGAIAINTVLLSIDCSQYRQLSVQCSSMGTSGVVTPQFSNDGTNWVGGLAFNASAGGPAIGSFNSVALVTLPVIARYFRLRLTTATTAGTTTILVNGIQQPETQYVLIGNTVAVSATNLSCNVAQIGGSAPATSVANGSTNRALAVSTATAISQVDQNATAFAGSGRVNGTVVASAMGGGSCVSSEINVTALTLGTATSVQFFLQESRGGTNFTDIWCSSPITATGIISVPATPVGGRRRWVCDSIGGTSTTVTTTITSLELPSGYVRQAEFVDQYAATNPTTTVINNATFASTLVSTSANSTSSVWVVEGCKNLTVYGVFTGGTPTTAPVYSLQVSNDASNWFTTSTSFTPTAAGTFASTASNLAWKYARLAVTTASSGGTPYSVTKTGCYGCN